MIFRTPGELLSKTPEDRLGFWQSAFWAWAGKLPLQTIQKEYPSFIQCGNSPEIQAGARILCQVITVTIT